MSKKTSKRASNQRRADKRASRGKRHETHVISPSAAFLRSFTGNGEIPQPALRRVKKQPTSILGRLIRSAPSRVMEALFGTTFPDSYSGTFARSVLPQGSVEGELRWATETICHFSTKLNVLLDQRTVFERHLLLGQYSEAKVDIQSLVSIGGHSLWTLNASAILSQLTGGLIENRTFIRDASAQLDHGFDKILLQFFGQRAETTLSSSTYLNNVKNFCNQYSPDPNAQKLLDYLRFKVSFQGQRSPLDSGYVLFVDSFHPIVDRFDTLLRVLQMRAINGLSVFPRRLTDGDTPRLRDGHRAG